MIEARDEIEHQGSAIAIWKRTPENVHVSIQGSGVIESQQALRDLGETQEPRCRLVFSMLTNK